MYVYRNMCSLPRPFGGERCNMYNICNSPDPGSISLSGVETKEDKEMLGGKGWSQELFDRKKEYIDKSCRLVNEIKIILTKRLN